jgi:phenylpropionate dioxygenase-like ring-hydroxylating dioxygenase large terminal subunit
LTDILRADLFDFRAGHVAEASTLPRRWYTSPECFQFEVETIFSHEWICLGRVEQIPDAGDYFTITFVDDPLIVVRDKDDTIRVLSAVCRHRGMVISEGQGNCEGHFTCPYHSWTYDLRGNLLGSPDMDRTRDFDKLNVKLPALRTEVWHGFIFANWDSEAPALAPRLTDIDSHLQDYEIDHLVSVPGKAYEFICNWKIFTENFMECYHCSHLHRGYHDCAPSRNTLPSPFPDHDAAVVLAVRTTHKDAAFIPPDYRALFPPLPSLTDEERHRMNWIAILPNLLVAYKCDHIRYSFTIPRAVDKVGIVTGWLYPQSTIELPTFQADFQRSLEAQTTIIAQDAFAVHGVQRGFCSRLAAAGRFSWQEETIAHINQWLIKRYRAEDGHVL